MDEIERKVAEHLRATAREEPPPPGLGARILDRTGRRRRQHRERIGAVAVGVVATLAIPVTVVAATGRGQEKPAPAISVTASPRPGGVTIPRALPGGKSFEVMALGTDGTVLGMAVSVDSDGFMTPERGVWAAGPRGGPPRRVADTSDESLPYLWTMAAGAPGLVWPAGESLKCLPADGSGEVRTLPRGWDGREPFYSDGQAIVWPDPGKGTLMAAKGCDARPVALPVKGTLVAFSGTEAYVRVSSTRVQQVNVPSGAARPIVVHTSDSAVFGAGRAVLAWAEGTVLTIQHLDGGERRVVVRGLPYAGASDYMGRVTVGNDFVIYTAYHQDRDSARSLVYDLRTGEQTTVSGEAWAAGDRLLRRDGDVYRFTGFPR